MGLKKTPANTYLNVLDSVYYNTEDVDILFIRELLKNFEKVASCIPFTSPIFFIIDYTQKKYISISDNTQSVLNYAPQEFMEGGIGFLLQIYQPDDFRIYNEKVFSLNADFLKSIQQPLHKNYVFSYNYRVRNADKKLVPVYQRSTYITSKETGLPLYNIGVVTDISLFKKDTLMLHTIEEYSNLDRRNSKKIIEHNYFYPYLEDALLTKREIEILKRIADGLGSEEIGKKLFISVNTVINHRKNMLQKTNTKNVAELIAFTIRNHII